MEGVAYFDNSPNNRFNPDPKAEVRWGEQSDEEMMIGFFDILIRSPLPSQLPPPTARARRRE